jgi:protein transport protein SEC24
MYIWVGDGVSPQILLDLFNVENWDEIGPRTASFSNEATLKQSNSIPISQHSLPELQTHLSVQVRNIITHGNLLRGRALPLHVVRQNMDGAEIEFSNLLVEDTNNDAMSYVDCELERIVMSLQLLNAVLQTYVMNTNKLIRR